MRVLLLGVQYCPSLSTALAFSSFVLGFLGPVLYVRLPLGRAGVGRAMAPYNVGLQEIGRNIIAGWDSSAPPARTLRPSALGLAWGIGISN